MKKLDQYLTIKEAAELMGVTYVTFRNWSATKKIKSYIHPINGYRVFLKEDLENILINVKERE